jgi:3-oxoacyl-[acyl-carrier-protein] synthase II
MVAEVDYINAHGTSTPLGDEIELGAVQRLPGNAADGYACLRPIVDRSFVGGSRSRRGDLLILAMRDGVVPQP